MGNKCDECEHKVNRNCERKPPYTLDKDGDCREFKKNVKNKQKSKASSGGRKK